MGIKVNQITEFSKGVYESILDFPTKDVLKTLVSRQYNYIWCLSYEEDKHNWCSIYKKLYGIPIEKVLIRNVKFEYIVETSQFIELIPYITGGVHIIQMNKIPPYYLRGAMDNLNYRTKYNLLRKETDFLFELDLPPSPDYTPLISPYRKFLEDSIALINKSNQSEARTEEM